MFKFSCRDNSAIIIVIIIVIIIFTISHHNVTVYSKCGNDVKINSYTHTRST